MNKRKLKGWIHFLGRTPFHPQWLMRQGHSQILKSLGEIGDGNRVVDVGCSSRWVKNHLPANCEYIGLDYPATASEWYGTQPTIFCDAAKLPIENDVADFVLMLNMLEHVVDAEIVLSEACRILKPKGRLIIQVPFLYPLHDEPRDFRRFTQHGLRKMLERHGMKIRTLHPNGTPMETSVLLANLAISKSVLDWFNRRSPLVLVGVFLPLLVLAGNLFANAISRFESKSDFMAFTYHIVAVNEDV